MIGGPCCDLHTIESDCCDLEDCGPCCDLCPTCPSLGYAWLNRLTAGERQYLGMQANYRAENERDPRYWTANPDERRRVRARWQHIADVICRAPWGDDARAGELEQRRAEQESNR